jgi:aminoglycoside 6'-N-acetyltransferase
VLTVEDVLAEDGPVRVRPMRDAEDDYWAMALWLTDPRVLEWYEGRDEPHDYARVVEKYSPRVLAKEDVHPCIIEVDGRAAGYLQYYPVEPGDYGLDDVEDTWAFDLFLGDPSLWGTGIGSRALRAVVRFVFEERGARRAVIDPHVVNPRAIRAYEKAGFAKLRILPRHELHEGELRDSWLMVMDAPPHQAGT